MTDTTQHRLFRKTLLALAVTLAVAGTAAPAFADDWGNQSDWRRQERREHEWREREWRRHEWREHHAYYGPAYAYPPSAYVQVPVPWWSR